MTALKDAQGRRTEFVDLCIEKNSLYKLRVLAEFSLKRPFESSCEKGAVTEGSVQALIIKPGWSLPGRWALGSMIQPGG